MPESPSVYPFKVRLLAWAAHGLVRQLGRTWKFEWEAGRDTFESLRAGEEPIILCAWHNRMLGCIIFVHRFWLRQGKPIGALISRSRDGDLGACVGERFGGKVIRGSPNKGALGSLRALFRLLAKDRISTLIFPDGSRGPKYRAKIGPVGLARMSGAVITPFSWEADRAWILEKSWDGYRVPKPFARIKLSIGRPIRVDKGAKEDQLEARRLELETELNRMQDEQPPE